jgi:hypothetical protein
MKNIPIMNIKTLFIASLISTSFVACQDSPKHEKRSQEEVELENKAQEPMDEHKERAYYPIPSPEQMFGFINDAGVVYSKELMNKTSNSAQYVNPTIKALNFGVYTADLAYGAAYQDIESTLDLYKVVKTMGSELHIEEMMSEEMLSKMQLHMQDKDSLAIIAGQSYYQAVEFLEQNEQEGKLALMSLGGWIESLYITINSLEELDMESVTAQRIADQKITFGNLYTYLKKNEDKSGIVAQLEGVQEIRSVFGSLIETKLAKVDSKDGSKVVLGGGTKISISESQYADLKVAINNYRNNIIKTN